MASTLEKIKTLLSTKEESKEIKMYAEMILDDGRVLATEDEKFDVGSEVYVVGDDGETEKISEGTYTLEDGGKITIDTDSKIASLGEEEAKEEEMAEEDESPAEKADWAKSYEELKDRVEALEKAVYGENVDVEEMEEVKEELSEEVVEDEKVEMSKDLVNSLVEEVEHLKSKIIELEKTPGTEGFTHNPEQNSKKEKVNLAKLSTKERVAYFMNSNKLN